MNDRRIAKLARISAEQEDLRIRKNRPSGRHASTCTLQEIASKGYRERDYQYIVWRSLSLSLPFVVERETEDHTDLIVRDQNAPATPLVRMEMKTWWSDAAEGDREIAATEVDIERLKSRKAQWGIEMVFSWNLPDKTKYWLNFLERKIHIKCEFARAIQTPNANGDDGEFWVGLFVAKRPVDQSLSK